MLTVRPRFDTAPARFKPVAPRPTPPRLVFVMNRGKSVRIGVSVISRFTPRMPTNDHKYIYGATTNEPDSATVELRYRPRPQFTTVRTECFKRLKIVVALSWRFMNHQDYLRITTYGHTGKCKRRFGGIYAYCRYFIGRKWHILVLILYRKTCHVPKGTIDFNHF